MGVCGARPDLVQALETPPWAAVVEGGYRCVDGNGSSIIDKGTGGRWCL